jgi:hypothetical protein
MILACITVLEASVVALAMDYLVLFRIVYDFESIHEFEQVAGPFYLRYLHLTYGIQPRSLEPLHLPQDSRSCAQLPEHESQLVPHIP